MNQHIKKLNRIKYILLAVVLAAVLLLFWFLNRAFVTITISPATAKLTVDNAPLLVNRNGVAKTTLSPGTHTIKLEAENFLFVSQEVNFKKGKRANLTFTLKEKPEIAAIELGARFISAGKNSNEIIYLDSASHTLIDASLSLDDNHKIVSIKTPITGSNLAGINQIVWSPNKDLALFKKNDGVYLFDFQKYDFVHQIETLWGTNIGDVAWAPDNSKIAYFNSANGAKSLVFSNIANTEQTRVANLADFEIDNPFLAWSPDSEYLIVIPRNKDYTTNKIYLYDTYSGSLNSITDTGDQISASFSPDSSKIIYSTYSKGTGDNDPYVVSIMNKDGSSQKSLDVRTSTENIVWNGSNGVLAAQYSRSGGSETFFTRDFNQETQSQSQAETIQSIESKIVNRVLLANDNKIAVYESGDGVFGFELK